MHCPILRPRKNGGLGERTLRTKARPWRLQSAAAVPRRVFGFFLRGQKGTRRKAKLGPEKPGRLSESFPLARQKKWGRKNTFPKARPLAFCFFLCEQKETRRKARPCAAIWRPHRTFPHLTGAALRPAGGKACGQPVCLVWSKRHILAGGYGIFHNLDEKSIDNHGKCDILSL